MKVTTGGWGGWPCLYPSSVGSAGTPLDATTALFHRAVMRRGCPTLRILRVGYFGPLRAREFETASCCAAARIENRRVAGPLPLAVLPLAAHHADDPSQPSIGRLGRDAPPGRACLAQPARRGGAGPTRRPCVFFFRSCTSQQSRATLLQRMPHPPAATPQ